MRGVPDLPPPTSQTRGCCFSPSATPSCFFPVGFVRPLNEPTSRGALVSIIMPCYQQEEYITAAIQSVLSQKYTMWELIVVDDGTPGFTCAAVARALLEEANLQDNHAVVLEKQNGGLSDARNYAITHARGDHFAMLDADDVLWPDYLFNVAEALEENPSLDIVYADQAFFGVPGNHRIWYLVPNMTLDYASQRGPLPVISVFSRRIYLAARGYRIDMIYGNEDYVFWLDLLQLGARTRKIDGISSWYRLKAASMRTDPGYVALAPAMTVSHNPLLYGASDPARVCDALAEIFCKLSAARDAARLQQATEKQPHSCPGWLWLALFKLHSGCATEALDVVDRGLAACSVPDSSGSASAHIAQLLVLRRLLISPMMAVHAGFAAQLHRDCARDLDKRKCEACQTDFSQLLDCPARLAQVMLQPAPAALPVAPPNASIPLHELLADAVTQALSEPPPLLPVPRIIHFVYGLSADPAPPFLMYHYIALRSALEVNAPVQIMFHYTHQPRGYWWQQARAFITLQHHEMLVEHQGKCLAHHAHKADVLRLQVLQEHGGVYMDMDTVSLRPWAPLFQHEFVMAWQDSGAAGTVRAGKAHYGLCNAAMVAAPGSRFAKLWLHSYAHFRSHGRDGFWDEHSVVLPANLTEAYPLLAAQGLISTIDAAHMWLPLWTTVQKELFDRAPAFGFNSYTEVLAHFPRAYMLHLWVSDGASHTQLLGRMEGETWWFHATRYGAIAKRYVELDAGFGARRRFRPRPLSGAGAAAREAGRLWTLSQLLDG